MATGADPPDPPDEPDADDTIDPRPLPPPEPVDPYATTAGLVPSTVSFEPGNGDGNGEGGWPGEPSGVVTAEARFRILRHMASGGLGQVLLARDEVFGREVALKQILARVGDDASLRDRFLVEAKVTGNLEHPGIVGVYAIGHDPAGRPFYVMRLVRGESLKEAIDRFHRGGDANRSAGQRTLELRKLINRLIAVCNAVAFAHSRGVLHRDIKPANVMCGKYGETLIVDWGLAKRLYKGVAGVGDSQVSLTPDPDVPGGGTVAGSIVGTPAYMSPEQAEGRLDLLEPTSDVYSLGATLYQILTGRMPIQGTGSQQLIEAARRGVFPPPREVLPSVDRALEAICLKAMAYAPEDRYATARALADDLERWVADAPVSAYRDPPARALSRWLGQHPQVLIRGLAVVVALLGLALAGIVLALALGGVRPR